MRRQRMTSEATRLDHLGKKLTISARAANYRVNDFMNRLAPLDAALSSPDALALGMDAAWARAWGRTYVATRASAQMRTYLRIKPALLAGLMGRAGSGNRALRRAAAIYGVKLAD